MTDWREEIDEAKQEYQAIRDDCTARVEAAWDQYVAAVSDVLAREAARKASA